MRDNYLNYSLTILFFIFMVLKLTGVIDWSWWFVTCPLWGMAAVLLPIYFLIWIYSILKK